MRDGEITTVGDAVARNGKADILVDPYSILVGEVCSHQHLSAIPFIRRIRKSRPHRFDGMTLGEVLQRLWEKAPSGCDIQYWLATRFAREVRRRDKVRAGK